MSTQTLTSNAQELCDAVLADLEGNVVFPESYGRHRYGEPQMVTPEFCPLLAVYISPDAGDTPTLVASAGCYVHTWRLIVAWWEAAGVQEETGGLGSELLAMRRLAVAQAIMDRIKAWPSLVIPGISTRYGNLDGPVDYPTQGFCWGATIPVLVNPV